jgi:hypothetical protein
MKSIKILVHIFDRTARDIRIPVGHYQEVWVCWQVADIPSCVFVDSKPDTFLGDDLNRFSLTTVARLWGVMVLLLDMKAKWRVVWEEKLSAIVEYFILLFTFPWDNFFEITCSILEHLQNL